MADLDDFFAKKDRKKTKTKKPSTDEVAKKKLDDTSKEVKPRKEPIENENLPTEEQVIFVHFYLVEIFLGRFAIFKRFFL